MNGTTTVTLQLTTLQRTRLWIALQDSICQAHSWLKEGSDHFCYWEGVRDLYYDIYKQSGGKDTLSRILAEGPTLREKPVSVL